MLPALVGCLLFLQSLFFVPSHDWDMDAFLYLGSRLWKGELLYFEDFETKLPFLQYLFAIAMALGGIGAWKIMTFLAVVILGLGASRILVACLVRRAGEYPLKERELSFLAFGMFAVLLYSLPGSMSAHIEMMAAAGAYMSLALLAAHPAGGKAPAILLLSGLALSFASLLRPNYIYVVPLCLLFIAFEARTRIFAPVWTMGVLAFVAGFAGLTGLAFVPYLLFPNGVDVLTEGLRALSGYSEGTGFGQLMAAQFKASEPRAFWFFASLYGVSILAVVLMALRASARRDGLWAFGALCLLAVVALNVSLARTHYWPHNAIMFVAYFVPLLLYVWSAVQPMLGPRRAGAVSYGAAGVCALGAVLLGAVNLQNLPAQSRTFDPDINRRGVNAPLLEYLQEAKRNGRTFLVVDAPIYHALLGESRVGDGHPAMLRDALEGRRVGPVSGNALFSGEGATASCMAVVSARKDLIVLNRRSDVSRLVLDCLASEPGAYEVAQKTRRYLILKRHRQ